MKKIALSFLWILFLSFHLPLLGQETASRQVVNSPLEETAEGMVVKMKEKTDFSPTRENELKQAWIGYLQAREKIFSQARTEGREVEFESLVEAYHAYKQSEREILTPQQILEIYGKEDDLDKTLSVTPASLPLGIEFIDINTPGKVTLEEKETAFNPIAYYVDFGTDNYVNVKWKIDQLIFCHVEIYAVKDKNTWLKCLKRIDGVSSGSLSNTIMANGRLLVYISQGATVEDLPRVPLEFTFSKTTALENDLIVTGNSYLQGNVGIGTTVAGEKLEVKGKTKTDHLFVTGKVGIGTSYPGERLDVTGTVRAEKLKAGSNSYFMEMIATNSSYAYFATNSNCFVFNKPVLTTEGVFSVYGSKDLQFRTQGTTRLLVQSSNGYLGIGTTTPGAYLDIGGRTPNQTKAILARLSEGDALLRVKSYSTRPAGTKSFAIEHHLFGKTNAAINFHRGNTNEDGHISLSVMDGREVARFDTEGMTLQGQVRAASFIAGSLNSDNDDLHLVTSGQDSRITILHSNGNVGIGTVNPENKLDVRGVIRAEEVVISTGWADFVFEEDYRLPSLKEVKEHIKEKKHLPGIPTEKEVKEKGAGLGEIQVKLLQKIEELTLYVIRQQEKIEELEKKIEDSKK